MVEVRILGPLEVTRGGTPLTLGGTKQRAVFAMLALRINRVVSMDSFVEGLWGSAPPNDPTNVVQVYLYRLRKVLRPTGTKDADAARLIYRKPGYLLQLDPEHLDLHRFQRLVQEGSHMLAAAPDTAAATLTDALALWRGAPLVEFGEQPFARTEISRLRELQLSALSARIRADLAVGRHAELIAELEDLTGRFPLHEGFRAQLMLSLYRSGRQAEALEAYRRARAVFAAEAGIDPGRDLQDLEAAVLVQDPLLDWTPPTRSTPAVADAGRADPPRDGERLEIAPARPVRVSNVPARNPHFTGRTGLLDQLHDQLRTDGDTLQVQALYGLGGVGKTQLAIEYAHRYAADYDLAWCIDAEQPVLIPDQLIGLAGVLGLPIRCGHRRRGGGPGVDRAELPHPMAVDLRQRRTPNEDRRLPAPRPRTCPGDLPLPRVGRTGRPRRGRRPGPLGDGRTAEGPHPRDDRRVGRQAGGRTG